MIKASGLNLTVEGDISNFLGVKIKRQSGVTIHMTQPQIIGSILEDLPLDGPNVATKNTPVKVGGTLKQNPNSQPSDGHFDYCSITGKANYLEKSTRPVIAYTVHQNVQGSLPIQRLNTAKQSSG
jgi:hypothetical protein